MTTQPDGNAVRYGKINRELIARWMRKPPESDGPFWALNLMKYRAAAEYTDGRPDRRTGREADDEYTPLESLAAVGARPVFAGEVERVIAGDRTAWDRVGIVRYPSRRAFFEMQQRDDFKKKHVHKDAGMEFTIVMSTLPVLPFPDVTSPGGLVELTVTAEAGAAPPGGAAVFDVEGVIVGDERVWSRASFRWLDEAAIGGIQAKEVQDAYVIILRPVIDRLLASVQETPNVAGTISNP
jgi:hypothetical protein